MRIGIVGLGIVGSALKYGFEKLGHQLFAHDVKLKTSIREVLGSEICFICVPTPSKDDWSCDTTIVEGVVSDLVAADYKGIIAIKSTVAPGTTRSLIEKYSNDRICFVPEFLRERCAFVDFIEKHDVCVIGTENPDVFSAVKKAHGKFPWKVQQLPPTEAELVKYFNNIYNATLVVFANSMYEICKSVGADYSLVKEAAVKREHIHDYYLDCNENFRGFGGMCLPKDTRAFARIAQEKGLAVKFFEHLLDENTKFKTTVLAGMRGEKETQIYELTDDSLEEELDDSKVELTTLVKGSPATTSPVTK